MWTNKTAATHSEASNPSVLLCRLEKIMPTSCMLHAFLSLEFMEIGTINW
jgi:hypothetical protein